jgi:hypothetical protein
MKIPCSTRLRLRVCGLAAALCLTLGIAHAQNFTGYDLIVPKAAAPNDVTVVDGTGITLPTNRSFIIGIEGGTRNPIEFRNWEGTAAFPIVITNRHGTGRASISDADPNNPSATTRSGIVLVHCKYIQLRGDNDPAHRYGIEIARAGGKNSGTGRRGVDVTGRSSDVSVSFLEIRDVSFAGIMVKQDPNCGPANAWTWAPTLVYRNISIHDNYIHDCGGEGLYVGFSFYLDDRCPNDADGGYAHNIEGLYIYNNLVERCAWDGIQVGAAPTDTQIFNNVIVDSGLGGSGTASGDTGVGVQIGAGTTGLLHSNLIINSRNNGISMFGIGNNIVYNNLIYGGSVGIFLDNRGGTAHPPERITQSGSPYYVYNNTFVGQSGHVMWTMSEVTDNHFKNNLALAAEPEETHNFIRYDRPNETAPLPTAVEAGNFFRRVDTGLNFADPANYDFRLLNSSSAVDQGVSLSTYVPSDFGGVARPQGENYDPGYAESGTLSVFLIATPPTSGNNGALTASAINGTAPYTYAWSTGASSATISGLSPGLYSVTVTDSASRVVKKASYLFTGAEMGAPVALTPATQVEAPSFNAPSGTYATSQSVTISTTTAGATIRYTTDGSTPTASHGTVYSGPFSVSATGALKAIAYKTGLSPSSVAVATYFVGTAPAAPTLSIVSISDRRVHLTWSSSPGASRYELKYATTSGGPYTSLGVLTTTAFTHNALSNGTTYYYVIDAANIYGTSANSAQATATPFPYPGTIGVLSGFTAGPTTVNSVTANGAFNAPPIWNATTQRPEGDDPSAHSSTGTNTANRFWTIDFNADFAKYHIVETWTRYRPSSPGDMPGFPVAWWDDDKDATNDGVAEPDINFQTHQDLVGSSAQQWFRDRDFGVAPLTPQNRYLVLGTGPTVTWRPNEFALIGWVDGPAAAPAIIQQPVAQNVPQHSSVSFTVGVTGSPTPSYRWRKNGVDIPGATAAWLELADVQVAAAGSYTVVVTNASGSITSNTATLNVNTPALTVLTPAGAGTAVGSAYCGAVGAFNEQPTWNATLGEPSGLSTSPHSSTATAYANRHWFIDLGTNWSKLRIVQMWTRYRPSSSGTHPGFAALWWDDDNDNVNDGTPASALNFNTGQALPNSGSQIWWKDRDFTATPVTPQGRYLVVSVGATTDDRPNEFAFVGYVVP